MNAEIWVLAAASMLLSALLTEWVRRVALARGILDSPNERSSHVRPTPRGGGIAIVVASFVAMSALTWFGRMEAHLFCALAGGGGAVALVGYLDDRGRIGIVGRFVVHVGAAIWAVVWLGGFTELRSGTQVIQLGYLGTFVAVIGVVWALNLFNFMDGIDGIAGSQAVFMAGAGAAFAVIGGLTMEIQAVALVICAASLGFLVWNWPPARIFMGDVGSGYLGFILAIVTLAATRQRPVMLAVWVILGGVFVVDATVTLIRRLARRERVYEAHRSHAYQWLVRRWASHRRVTIACLLLNILWLCPWAWLCLRFPERVGWLVISALAPLVALALACGAGRRENPGTRTSSSG